MDKVSAILTSTSLKQVLKILGLPTKPKNYRDLRLFIQENNINVSHFSRNADGDSDCLK